MAKDNTDRLQEEIDRLEERLRAVETAIALQGLKVSAIVVLIVTVFSGIGAAISHKLPWLAKWWSAE